MAATSIFCVADTGAVPPAGTVADRRPLNLRYARTGRLAFRYRALASLLGCVAALSCAAIETIHTCENADGRVILRDAPCKRTEIDRSPSAPAPAYPTPSPDTPSVPMSRKLTETQARDLADMLDAGFARRDAKAIASLLSPDAVIEAEYRFPEGVQTKRFNKDEYTAYLKEAFKAGEYSYQRDQLDVTLSPGAEHAEAVSSLRGSVLIRGQTMVGTTRSRVSVEMRGGRAMIVMVREVISFTGTAADDRPIK